jgi:hypothetical protein
VRHRRQQLLRVGVPGVVEHLVDHPLLDDETLLHHEHPVGEVGDDTHVVRDEDDAGVDAVA